MCGIYFSLSRGKDLPLNSQMIHLLSRRGPDCLDQVQRTLNMNGCPSVDRDQSSITYLNFVSTVLSLRGDKVTAQPLVDNSSGSVLCWNGEAWKINDKPVAGNDTLAVFHSIIKASQSPAESTSQSKADKLSLIALVNALSAISGPFSFLYYDAANRRVVYGRDMLGRRSLLVKRGSGDEWTIASIYDGCSSGNWEEVEADGIYSLDLTTRNKSQTDFIPWAHSASKENPYTNMFLPILNRTLPDRESSRLKIDSNVLLELKNKLQQSIELRVNDVPQPPRDHETPTRIGILFSGGLDCTLIARIVHNVLPVDCSVDLLNVAFENPRVAAATKSSQLPGVEVLAEDAIYSRCPDRMTGISSYCELLRICPERTWRFISINIPYSETIEHRAQVITLMHPHNTEMDLSIAYALYFAARGKGFVKCSGSASPSLYETPARVLLSGLGADELFAGYTRHAIAFRRTGYAALLDELDLDFHRLGKRNLGRDDRVISYWGKEARYPYLDEDFVSWALRQPVWTKYHFIQSPIAHTQHADESTSLEPGKHLLRLLAQTLGMKDAAVEKKRAIQFGARTAKMIRGKSKGTEAVVQ